MTLSRNKLLLAICLAALIPATAPAAGGTISIDCNRPYISQRDASRVLGTDNFAHTYDKRQALYTNVARTCKRGVERVLLVGRERPDRTRLAVHRADRRPPAAGTSTRPDGADPKPPAAAGW